MADPRFFPPPLARPLGELLAAAGFPSPDDARAQDLLIAGADELATAGPGDLALVASRAYAEGLEDTRAGAVIVAPEFAARVPAGSVPIPADAPHALFVTLLDLLYPDLTRALAGVERPDLPEPFIEEGVVLGANVVLGRGVEIGRNTRIGPNTVIGPGVAIGRNCVIGANCTLECAYLGNEVVVHAGARIGTDGFGWLSHGKANRKIPQLGRIIVQDRCQVGPNATLDRGALGDTVLGENTKLGNLVVIGHNSRLGRNCMLAPVSGVAGSTVLGDGVVMGIGSGTAGHLSIGPGSLVYARTGVTKSWPAGSELAGMPAQDVRDYRKEVAAIRRLGKGE